MAEKLCKLRKYGGGSKNALESFQQNSIPLNSNYSYIGTGTFLFAELYRNASVQAQPYIEFYIKEGNNYTPVSQAVGSINQTNTYVGANVFTEGDIYFKKASGTDVNIKLTAYYLK